MKQLLLAGLIFAAGTCGAEAQTLCASHDTMVKVITESASQEALAFSAKAGDYQLEFYLNPATGTWTAVYVAQSGMACVQAVGTEFKTNDLPKGEPS